MDIYCKQQSFGGLYFQNLNASILLSNLFQIGKLAFTLNYEIVSNLIFTAAMKGSHMQEQRSNDQDRREGGGVAGATAPGPRPRQGPVERGALLFHCMLQWYHRAEPRKVPVRLNFILQFSSTSFEKIQLLTKLN